MVGADGNGYCVIEGSDGMQCWGDNRYGELGNGLLGGPDGQYGYDSPQPVDGTGSD